MVSETVQADVRILKIRLKVEKRKFQTALKDDDEFYLLKNILDRIRLIEKDLLFREVQKEHSS